MTRSHFRIWIILVFIEEFNKGTIELKLAKVSNESLIWFVGLFSYLPWLHCCFQLLCFSFLFFKPKPVRCIRRLIIWGQNCTCQSRLGCDTLYLIVAWALLKVDFNKKTTPLEGGAPLHQGCILCNELLYSLVEMKHGRLGFQRIGSRGRGFKGGSRNSGKMIDPKMSFGDF